MSAKIYSIPEQFKNTMPSCWDDKIDYQTAEKQWLEDLEDYVRDNYGVGKYIGRIIRFQVADGYAMYMVMSLTSKVKLIHLPLMDGYQSEFPHLMTIKAVKAKIDSEDKFEAHLNSWKSQTVGDVEAVLEKVAIKSDEPREGYMYIKWLNVKYLLPIYSAKHDYDHGIYKYLCNKFKV
jgi:hypothetical protein